MPAPDLRRELRQYLDGLIITSQNIGAIRQALFVPWDSDWNGWVREDTAAREAGDGAGSPIEERERTPDEHASAIVDAAPPRPSTASITADDPSPRQDWPCASCGHALAQHNALHGLGECYATAGCGICACSHYVAAASPLRTFAASDDPANRARIAEARALLGLGESYVKAWAFTMREALTGGAAALTGPVPILLNGVPYQPKDWPEAYGLIAAALKQTTLERDAAQADASRLKRDVTVLHSALEAARDRMAQP